MENNNPAEDGLLMNCYKNEKMNSKDVTFYLRKRYLVGGFVFLGATIIYILQTNISISIVDMTSNKSKIIGNKTFMTAAEFNWTSVEKGLILSSFAWGFWLAPVGAILARKFGGATIFGAGIFLTGFIPVFTSTYAKWGLPALLISRAVEGVFKSFSVVSASEIFVHWAPPRERSRLVAGAHLGKFFGSLINYPLCGFIAFYFGWRAVFYVAGVMSIVWCIFWFTLVRNSPLKDNLMLPAEKEYLREVNPHISEEKAIYPWKKILMSKAVWAFVNDRFVEGWSLSFLGHCLPMYIKDVHDVNIRDIGLISGIPHFCAVVGVAGGAVMADYLRNHKILSITNVHKVYLTFSQTAAVVLLLVTAFSQNFLISIISLSLFRLCFTICEVSYHVLPLDLGARTASAITCFGNMSLSLAYMLNPIVLGLIVTNHSSAEWSRYFLLISAFNLWGGIVFFKYGSGELQPWAISGECKSKK